MKGTKIIGYWCTRCEDNGRKSFFFRKEGYCECMDEMGEYQSELGTTGPHDGAIWGFKDSQIKKCQKNWVKVTIEIDK